jgi:hypothetical protein
MPTITQMIRSGDGEFSSASLCRDSAIGTGKVALYEPLLAAADRIDILESVNKVLLLAAADRIDILESENKVLRANIRRLDQRQLGLDGYT